MNVCALGVDTCGKEGLIMIVSQQQQRFRNMLPLSPSPVAAAAACRLHVAMANTQWCG